MNIKKLLALFTHMLIVSSGFAQLKWRAEAGLTYSNVRAKDQEGTIANTSAVPGVYLGLGTTIYLSDRVSLDPTLVYARRGFKQQGSSFISRGNDFEAKVSYLELPVDLQYSPEIGPGHLLLAVGPYLGYGTGGNWTSSGTVLIGDIMIDGKGDVAFQNDNSYGEMSTYVYAKPWDYGAHFRIGYSLFNQYTLAFDLQHGIADLQPRWSDYKPKSSVRNRFFGVSLGYRF